MARARVAREALLDAIVERFVVSGIADFSLRSLAADLGTSHQLLLYHFRDRRSLLEAALARIQATLAEDLDAFLAGAPERRRPSKIWRHLTEPGPARLVVQYQCLGLALVHPDQYGDLAAAILRDWRTVASKLLADHGLERRERDAAATLLVAAMRGLGLDLIATGDRRRLNRAAAALDEIYDHAVDRRA